MADTAPKDVADNIDQVIGLEEALTAGRGRGARLGDAIGRFAGTFGFVVLQLALVLAWVAVNTGRVPGVTAFDPFPFSLGGEVLTLEGVLLASFVLMKQAHEARLSERRSHLALQANLLVEKEVTTLIQMVHRMSIADGTEHRVIDDDAHSLGQDTEVGDLAEQVDRRLNQA